MSVADKFEDIIENILRGAVPNLVNQGITVVDISKINQPLVYINSVFELLTRYKKNQILGRNCNFLQNTDKWQPDISLVKTAIHARQPCTATLRNYTKDGDMFWNKLRLYPYTADESDHCIYYIGLQENISEQMRQSEQIQYLYSHDLNTNLYNYLGYYEETNKRIEYAKLRNKLISVGIIRVHFIHLKYQYCHEFSVNRIVASFAKLLKKQFHQHAVLAKLQGLQFAMSMVADINSEEWFITQLSKIEDDMNATLPDFYKFRLSYFFKTSIPHENICVDQMLLEIIQKI